ncbi:MAG: hypothetical protein NTU98_07215 [Bacteroidetes bacterium]|nr:hypothetical protein [Bacteroidota bacterium]
MVKKLIHFLINYLFIFLFFTGIYSVPAQNSKERSDFQYFNKTEFSIGLGFGSFKTDIDSNGYQHKVKNDQIIFSFQTINGVSISKRFGLGIGIGAEFWQHGMFYPLFAHIYYDFKKEQNTPFAFMNIGKAFGTRDSTHYYNKGTGGTLFSIGAGYKMKVGKRFKFEYALFYRYQAILSTYQTEYVSKGTVHYSTTDYKVPYHFGGFRIAIIFQ